MIKAVGNNYNINFKSARVRTAPKYNMPPKVKKLMKLAVTTSPINEHLTALYKQGIEVASCRLDTKVNNRVHMCYRIDKIDQSSKQGTSVVGAIGQVETLQDARLLIFESIKNAWNFCLENASEYDFHHA